MTDPVVVRAGEMGVEELLELLKANRRVVVQTEFLGSEHEVTLRWDGETYMRTCLSNQGYGHDHEE
jgi:hypothetical protein